MNNIALVVDKLYPYHRKLRHECFIQASTLTHHLISSWENDLPKIKDQLTTLAYEYVEDVSNKVILLEDPSFRKTGFGIFLAIPYITRFDERYIKRIRKKFKRLAKSLSFIRGRHTFLTVTFDPRNMLTLQQVREDFSKAITRLLDLIKKKFNFLGYVKCFEFTDSGLIHAHILLVNVRFIHPGWLTNTLNRLSLGKIKHIKEFKGNVIHGFNYFLKYFRKQFDFSNHDGGFSISLILSWALNLRTYSLSRSLVDLSNRCRISSRTKGWVYFGCLPDRGVYGCLTGSQVIRFWEDWLRLRGLLLLDGSEYRLVR